MAALQECLEHKNIQFKLAGIKKIFGAADLNYFKNLLEAEGALLQVFTLTLDGRTVASIIGAKTDTAFWLLVNSLAPDAVLQNSPGDYLLRRVIARCCEAGFEFLDFSLGEQEYKKIWADTRVSYFHNFTTRKAKGLPLSLINTLWTKISQKVKQRPWLRDAYLSLRQRLRGVKP